MARTILNISSANDLDIYSFTSAYLYGTLEIPKNLYERIKAQDFESVDIQIDTQLFLESAGRFANPARIFAVQKFFDRSLIFNNFSLELEAGTYTAGEIALARNLFSFQTLIFDDGQDAQVSGFESRFERAYVSVVI